MGIPSSRFLPFFRLVLLPPLLLLTLTCLYTSSTLRPFNSKHHLSFSQDVQCFSCESSSFTSRSFLSLANFPATSYIRDVVLRHNVLNVEDSRPETKSKPLSRRDTNQVESENVQGDVHPQPDTTSEQVKEEVSNSVVHRKINPQQESLDQHPKQPVRREKVRPVLEERPKSFSSDENVGDNSKVESSVSEDNAAPFEAKIDVSIPSEKTVHDSVVPSDENVDGFAPDENVGENSKVESSVSEDNAAPFEAKIDVSIPSEKTVHDSVVPSDENVDGFVPEDKNVDDSLQVVELSTEMKESSDGGRKEDNYVDSSVPEEKNIDRSIQVVEPGIEANENSGEVRKEEDLELENRHLTSDDDHASPEEHSDPPIEANTNSTEGVSESPVEQPTPVPVKEEVMMFGHMNMSEEHRFAGISVQNMMKQLARTALSKENGKFPTDSDEEVSLLLRGGLPQGVPLPEEKSCEGRHVFVYDLPSKFNFDLSGQCDNLLRWFNFCDYFMNEGMGTNVATDVVNDEGEKVLVPDGSWFLTHQYALELIFHARLKHYPCLTTDINQANLFFVPYYAGLDVVRWHFLKNVTDDQRDGLTNELLSWLDGQESWSRNNGIDHVFVLGKISWDFRRSDGGGRHWGSKLLNQPEMGSPTKLLIERNPWHVNDVGVPHPTFFHPKDDNEIRIWLAHVEQAERRYFVSFAGMPRPNMLTNVRGALIQQCLDNPDDCFLLRCEKTICMRPDSTMNLFLHSHFCMQPPGDSPTRRSVFDSLVGGCIPVLFDPYTAYYQYPWHLPQNASSYSVFIPGQDVMAGRIDIVSRLKSITAEERTAMRMRIIREVIPGLLYSQPGTKHSDFRDAFDISIEALLRRVANLRAEKQNYM